VLAPDGAFIRKERVEAQGKVKGYWPGAPDLAVEVISPSDSYSEVEEKAMEWINAGCRVVVILNPRNRTVTIFRSLRDIALLTVGDTVDLSDVLTGWSLPVLELFG
jgi:Uma2 family endonuclease